MHWNAKDRNAPVAAAENQPITAEHPAKMAIQNQSTSSPDED